MEIKSLDFTGFQPCMKLSSTHCEAGCAITLSTCRLYEALMPMESPMPERDLYQLPENLPVPTDDGTAAHLEGLKIPSITLASTDSNQITLAAIAGHVAVFTYPRTGQPGQPPLISDWDLIPGARGCTPQTCAFRDLAADFARYGCQSFWLSTQDTQYQQEMATRLHITFPVLSDADQELTNALRLPSFTVGKQVLLKRLGWIAMDGKIIKTFYPVFPPDRHAQEMLTWLADQNIQGVGRGRAV